jgi:hypothetical protein
MNSESNINNKLLLRPVDRAKIEELNKRNSNLDDSDSGHVYLDKKGLTWRDLNKFKLTNTKVKYSSETN